jgi:hypothetical protein
MSDEKVRAVLARAAEDRTFFDALMTNRESALGAFDLAPEEKAILMAPTDEQLRGMVEQARKRPWSSLARVGFFAGGLAAAAAVTATLALPLTATTGIRSEGPHVMAVLKQISAAEELYRREHGCYASEEQLAGAGYLDLRQSGTYVFDLAVNADTFTATARHKTRPDTRPAFRVGPDGEVRRVE